MDQRRLTQAGELGVRRLRHNVEVTGDHRHATACREYVRVDCLVSRHLDPTNWATMDPTESASATNDTPRDQANFECS
jgi:hypothetical protein